MEYPWQLHKIFQTVFHIDFYKQHYLQILDAEFDVLNKITKFIKNMLTDSNFCIALLA